MFPLDNMSIGFAVGNLLCDGKRKDAFDNARVDKMCKEILNFFVKMILDPKVMASCSKATNEDCMKSRVRYLIEHSIIASFVKFEKELVSIKDKKEDNTG